MDFNLLNFVVCLIQSLRAFRRAELGFGSWSAFLMAWVLCLCFNCKLFRWFCSFCCVRKTIYLSPSRFLVGYILFWWGCTFPNYSHTIFTQDMRMLVESFLEFKFDLRIAPGKFRKLFAHKTPVFEEKINHGPKTDQNSRARKNRELVGIADVCL